MVEVIDLIKDRGLTLQWREGSLDFSPADALDDDLKVTLRSEAQALHKRGSDARTHLGVVVANKQGNPRRWERLHKRLMEQWPDEEIGGYSLLVAWVGAYFRLTAALLRLAVPKVPAAEREGRRADVRWSERLIPSLERRLVGSSILEPCLHERLMRLK